MFEPFAQALLQSMRTDEASEPPEQGGPKKKRKRNTTPHGRRVLPEHLPVETLVLTPSPLPESSVQIGAEVSWRLGYRRASYYRLRVVRPLYVVPKEAADEGKDVSATLLSNDESAQVASSSGELAATDTAQPAQEQSAQRVSLNNTQDTTIAYAPAPDEMIPRGLPTPDLLAHILVGKFADKLPFHRQEGICAREGVPITRGTMCGWAAGALALAHHVVDAMVEDGRQHAHVIATDATGVLVQANERCKKGHFWVYVADREHAIFRYSASHSSNEPTSFFKGFRGTVLSDASNVYDVLFGLPDSPGEANCWSHARRYFYKAIDSENRDEALIGVGFCNKLFELERQWKKLILPHFGGHADYAAIAGDVNPLSNSAGLT